MSLVLRQLRRLIAKQEADNGHAFRSCGMSLREANVKKPVKSDLAEGEKYVKAPDRFRDGHFIFTPKSQGSGCEVPRSHEHGGASTLVLPHKDFKQDLWKVIKPDCWCRKRMERVRSGRPNIQALRSGAVYWSGACRWLQPQNSTPQHILIPVKLASCHWIQGQVCAGASAVRNSKSYFFINFCLQLNLVSVYPSAVLQQI